MKKQLIGTGVVALSSLFLVACGQKTVTSGSHTIYDTKITSTKAVSEGDWLVKGTTDAPDGTKIMAVSTTNDTPDNASSGSDIDTWPKAKNGKFEIHVDAITASDHSDYKAGQKSKVAIFGITKYSKENDDQVSTKIIKAFKTEFKPTTLTLKANQAKYLNNLGAYGDGDESSSESSTSSSSSSTDTSSYQTVTYDQIARNPDDYQDSEVKLTGQVMQVQNAHNGSVVLLWLNDDPDQLVMVGINKDYMPDNGNILEDDEITVYGTGDGTQKYDTTSGAKNEVPFVRADATTTDSGKSNSAY